MGASPAKTAFTLYPYARSADQDSAAPAHHPVVVVGAGPVGLALALDLGQRGTPVVVLDASDGVGAGSRAICFAKRTLEIADRLGAGADLVEAGVVWNVGKVFHGDRKVFEFNLSPQQGHRNPAFINLGQPWFEKTLMDAVMRAQAKGAPIEIRGCNTVTALTQTADQTQLTIDTPQGPYPLLADWVVACDGARSPLRTMLGLGFEGRVFEDNFLIADIRMTADFPTERWFWFEPPFKDAGRSALLHKQPDNVWRLDFQLGWDIDRSRELDPARIRARVDAMLGAGAEYTLEWTSIYTFQCRRMESFRSGRTLFAGDSAHQVSPFGARGANSGIQDADNLAWKLDLVRRGAAPDSLLDSYNAERMEAADENILNSTRSTDFLTPKTPTSQRFRDAVLTLAQRHAFARPLVNSGRLSVPCIYTTGGLHSPDGLDGPAATRPGATCVDAPLDRGFLLDRLGGPFILMAIDAPLPDVDLPEVGRLSLSTARHDPTGALADRYLGPPDGPGPRGAVYLIRPDQHVAARWSQPTPAQIRAALARATGQSPPSPSQTEAPCP